MDEREEQKRRELEKWLELASVASNDPTKIYPIDGPSGIADKLSDVAEVIYKVIKNAQKGIKKFENKHRKAVVRAKLIAIAIAILTTAGKTAHHQMVGRDHIAHEVVDNNPDIFKGLQMSTGGLIRPVEGGKPIDVSPAEVSDELRTRGYDDAYIAITLEELYGITGNEFDFLDKYNAADEAYKASITGKDGKSR